jgi:hypothetical protein
MVAAGGDVATAVAAAPGVARCVAPGAGDAPAELGGGVPRAPPLVGPVMPTPTSGLCRALSGHGVNGASAPTSSPTLTTLK